MTQPATTAQGHEVAAQVTAAASPSTIWGRAKAELARLSTFEKIIAAGAAAGVATFFMGTKHRK